MNACPWKPDFWNPRLEKVVASERAPTSLQTTINRMKKIILALVIAMISWTSAQADNALSAPVPDGNWENLFAADLTNAVFSPGIWSWKDGELSPRDKDEAIWTKQEYENFVLDLEFKLEPGANSGVFVYNTDLNNWTPNTVEIQILDDPDPKWANIPPNWKCGGIFGHSVPLKSPTKKAGEWNHITIWCRGPAIKVQINGEVVTDLNMQDWKSGTKNPDGSDIPNFEPRPLAQMATKGRIGLQGAHGGIPTHFRNLRIKSIE